jgi:hypothetical protein
MAGFELSAGSKTTSEPVGGMAGFESPSTPAQPVGPIPWAAGAGTPAKVAGFDSKEPVGGMAGFAPSNPQAKHFRTVSRSIPSSRAIRRWDQCIECNNSIECIFAILSRFVIRGLHQQKEC